ncbi:retention module-containing protein [Halomonas organivorans]
MTIATVVSITGQAWARDADGELRELSVGDSLQEGEILVTSDNGRVVLDFGDGLEPTAVPGGEEVAMTPELALDATVSAEEASAQDEDLEALLAALEEGEGDLLEDLEATAAGAGGGGGSDGGHSFVRLARISESVDPLAFGFGTNSLEGADQVELDPTLAAAEPAAPEPDDIPSVDTQDLDGDGDTVWEAALEGGSAQGGEGGEAGPGISTTTSGALQIDTGVDSLALVEVQDANGDWIAIESAGTLVQGAYGTLSVDPDGSWSYTLDANTLDHDDPTATGAGDQVQDPFAVRVTDDDGDVSPEATLTIDVNDDGPVAADDGVDGEVAEDGSVEIDVFANDAAGADGVNLATGIALASGPSQGSVVYNGDGTFTYTADAGAEGSDSFTYTLTDREGDTSTATVTLTIAEDSTPTVATPDLNEDGDVVWESALDGGSGGGTTTTAGALQIDTGGDTLALVEVQDANGDWIAIDSAGTLVQGAYGTLSVDPDGSWSYTLDANTLDHDDPMATGAGDQVQDPFAVRVTDDDGDVSPEATLTIDVNDDGPVAADDGVDGEVAEDGSVEIDVFANDAAGADGVNLATGIALASGPSQGSVVYNGDGTFTYTADAGAEGSDSFTYTLTDREGDTSTATVTLTIAEDSTPTVATPDLNEDGDVVWESALDGGSGGGTTTTAGALQIDTGGDTLALVEVQDANGDWIAIESAGTLVQGAYGTLSVDPDGSWSYTLDANTLDHDDPTATGAGDQVQDPFAVRVTDDDGDVSPEATLTIDVNDDGPVAVDDGVDGEVAEDGSVEIDVFANDAAGADGVNLATGIALASGPSQGSVVYNGDGTFTYTADAGAEGSDSFTYTLTDREGDTSTATVTLTIAEDSTPTVATPDLNEDGDVVWESALDGGSGGGTTTTAGALQIDTGGDTLALVEVQDANGDWIAIDSAGTLVQGAYGTLSVDPDGSWSYTLDANTLDHDDPMATGAGDQVQDPFAVRVTDDDGDVSPEATLTIDVNDDGPVAIAPEEAFLLNVSGEALTGLLDLDGQVEDNVGADRNGLVRFPAALETPDTGLTSGGLEVTYQVSADGQLLTASTAAGTVFTLTLNPAADGGQDTYTLDMVGTLDGGATQIEFNDEGGYDFVGGNGPWAGFNNDADDDSRDLLLTPMEGGTSAGTVNTNANEGGISAGNSVGANEAMRVDYVIDLTGEPSSNEEYEDTGADNHGFEGHYTVNGASALFTKTSDSTVLIRAFDDTDGDTTVGDGTQDDITAVGISFGDENALIAYAEVGTTPEAVTLEGHTFTVTFVEGAAGREVSVQGVTDDTSLSTFTADGYTSVEYHHDGGDTFKIGDFGTTAIDPGEPVSFTVPVDLVDADGDASTGEIDVLLLPEASQDYSGAITGVVATASDDQPDILGSGHDDTLTGNEQENLLVGAGGDDHLVGEGGDDTLIGGLGADTFSWGLGDEGSAGTPAEDRVEDFTLGTFGTEANADKLDIADLLSGMSGGDALSHFLQATEDASSGTTTLHISSAGNMSAGDVSNADQSIVLEGVSMGGVDQAAFLQSLIDDGQLDIE